jgi:sRNA-binding carbon storage regulator CsrA
MPLRLDRREGQSITVPGDTEADDIVIRVHSIRGDRVRLEVSAHVEQDVFRTELFDKLKKQETNHGGECHGR